MLISGDLNWKQMNFRKGDTSFSGTPFNSEISLNKCLIKPMPNSLILEMKKWKIPDHEIWWRLYYSYWAITKYSWFCSDRIKCGDTFWDGGQTTFKYLLRQLKYIWIKQMVPGLFPYSEAKLGLCLQFLLSSKT